MPETETLTLAVEVTRWKSELEALRDDGNRIAKSKLKELDNIPASDSAGMQNWVQSLFWLSRRNELMGEAQGNVTKGRPRKAKAAAEGAVEASVEAKPKPEPKPEPRRRQYKSLAELVEAYEAIKAIRLDGKVHSANIEAFAVADPEAPEDAHPQLWLRITAPKDPTSGQTIPAGEYRMLDIGIVTFCRRLGMSYSYFTKYPKRHEIVEHMNVLNKANEKDYVLRLLKEGETYVIQAVLPKAFVPIDHADVLGALVHNAQETQLGESPVLDAFYEGMADKAVDVIDIRLPGNVDVNGKLYRPLLRIVNSEVDMAPLSFSVGALSGKNGTFVSMSREKGAIRIPHRGKSGDIKDWIKINDMVAKVRPIAEAIEAVAEKPLHKARTTEFLVHKLGIAGTDVEAVLTDYFVVNPGPDTLGTYALGLASASKAFPISKMVKMCDLAMVLVYGDIPTVI